METRNAFGRAGTTLFVITHVMQEWTTLRGPGTLMTFRQPADEWLDLEGFRDLTMWVQVLVGAGGAEVRVSLGWCAREDGALFRTLSTVTSAGSLAPGAFVMMSRANMASVPLARFLRWTVTATSPNWNLTFRLVVSLNPIDADYRATQGDFVIANALVQGSTG